MDREAIRRAVRDALVEKFAPTSMPASVAGWRRFDDAADRRQRLLVTEADVLAAYTARSPVIVPDGSLVTPLARETADRLGVAMKAGPLPVKNLLAVASDHGGFAAKEALKPLLVSKGITVIDLGTHSTEAVDWPDFAHQAAFAVVSGRVARAVVIDGSGVASAMACNRHAGVRAAPCAVVAEAISARSHNDANVLCLGSRIVKEQEMVAIVDAFLDTAFEGGRHTRRVALIEGS